jgi:hypothetical protein
VYTEHISVHRLYLRRKRFSFYLRLIEERQKKQSGLG